MGIAASAGLALGPARVLAPHDVDVHRRALAPSETVAELQRFTRALDAAQAELEALAEQLAALGELETRQILEVQRMLLADETVRAETARAIESERVNAEFAFHRIFLQAAAAYEASPTETFRDRAVDFRDVSRRVLRHLTGDAGRTVLDLEMPCVIVAHDLEPSQTIHFHKGKVLAVVTDVGGRTSHSALLARSHGIPAVVGLRNVTREIKDGDLVAVDGFSGAVWPRPSTRRAARFKRRARVLEAHGKELESLRDLPATT
ncbi:MAG: phosphoenolpyruvate-utilizing N-terminal domain-containing protein, partial [Candidatus Eisenbacteria bacterium]